MNGRMHAPCAARTAAGTRTPTHLRRPVHNGRVHSILHRQHLTGCVAPQVLQGLGRAAALWHPATRSNSLKPSWLHHNPATAQSKPGTPAAAGHPSAHPTHLQPLKERAAQAAAGRRLADDGWRQLRAVGRGQEGRRSAGAGGSCRQRGRGRAGRRWPAGSPVDCSHTSRPPSVQ